MYKTSGRGNEIGYKIRVFRVHTTFWEPLSCHFTNKGVVNWQFQTVAPPTWHVLLLLSPSHLAVWRRKGCQTVFQRMLLSECQSSVHRTGKEVPVQMLEIANNNDKTKISNVPSSKSLDIYSHWRYITEYNAIFVLISCWYFVIFIFNYDIYFFI